MGQELKIKHLSGSMQGKESIFRDFPLTIGRADDCLLKFDPDRDLKVSAHHAEIRRSEDGGFEAHDLDSKNGLYVNGSKVSGFTQLPSRATLEVGKGGPKIDVILTEGGSGITFADLRRKETTRLAEPKSLHATEESFPVYDSQEMGSAPALKKNKTVLIAAVVIVLAVLGVIVAMTSMS